MPDPFDDAPGPLAAVDDSSYEPEDSSPAAAADAVDTPTADGAATETAAPQDKRQQNLLAQRGRELAAERKRRQDAERTATQLAERQSALEEQLAQMRGDQAERDRQATEAALSRLPPDQRAEARIQMLEGELEQIKQREQARVLAQQRIAYRAQRKGELIRMANEHYGLSGDAAIRGDEPELDDRAEATFVAGLKAMGAARQQYAPRAGSGEDSTVATRRRNGTSPTGESEAARLKRENDELRAELQRATGVTRPNSPRATGGGGVAAGAVQQIVRGKFTSHQDRMRQLREARDEIAAGP